VTVDLSSASTGARVGRDPPVIVGWRSKMATQRGKARHISPSEQTVGPKAAIMPCSAYPDCPRSEESLSVKRFAIKTIMVVV
jgi:hypothetical protein